VTPFHGQDRQLGKVRIQKYLAAHGVASRRAIEEMFLEGRITVNGRVPEGPPCFVDPQADQVRVDGRKIGPSASPKVYFLLNKPKGVVCTQSDPQDRTRAVDLIAPPTGRKQAQLARRRIYCVGRLDADTTGIIVLTNDGELTDLLTHPSHGVPKTYTVEVDGRITGQQVEKLKAGAWLDNKRTSKLNVKVLQRGQQRSVLSIRLTEGRNREIRRLLAGLGIKTRRLKRVAIGPVTDRGLKVGSWRILSPAEVTSLRRAAAQPAPRATRPAPGATRPAPGAARPAPGATGPGKRRRDS